MRKAGQTTTEKTHPRLSSSRHQFLIHSQRKLCHLFKVEMYQPYTNIIMAGRIASSFYIIRQGIIACENDDGSG